MDLYCNQIWSKCLSLIKSQISEQTFKTWFEPIVPLKFEDHNLSIQVPSQFYYEWLESHYRGLMDNVLMQILGEGTSLSYHIKNENNLNEKTQLISGKMFGRNIADDSQLNVNYTFDNFVEGSCNQFAKAVALAVANAPGKTAFNPLLIYGGVGLGKTHLIQAIGNYSKTKGLAKKIRYVSSEKFTTEFINSILHNRTAEFSNLYRNYDLLLLDDIHFFINKERTQEEFFHTFNELYQKGNQIVLSSDRPPGELKGLEERLISRFNWGIIADIQPPDLETRMAILQKKAEQNGIDLPSEVAFFVASNIESNIRELEGALNIIFAHSRLTGKEITIEVAKTALRDIIKKKSSNITIEGIQRIVCEHFGIQDDLIRAKTRRKEIVLARQTSMYLAKKVTNSSLKTIGLHFGGRDHSTVIHAYQTIEKKLQYDVKLRETIELLLRKIEISSW